MPRCVWPDAFDLEVALRFPVLVNRNTHRQRLSQLGERPVDGPSAAGRADVRRRSKTPSRRRAGIFCGRLARQGAGGEKGEGGEWV